MMSDEIGEVYEKLKSEIIWLHGKWIIYLQLFGKSERRVEFLNSCSSTYFYIIQNVIYDEIQISLSKLTDPAKTGKNKNLSLNQLVELLNDEKHEELSEILSKIIKKLKEKCEPLRMRRNKQLAHFDFNTLLNKEASSLKGVSRKAIEENLELVRAFMNQIEGHFFESEVGYEHFLMRHDAETLITWLQYGKRYEELLQEGGIDARDWQNGYWFGV